MNVCFYLCKLDFHAISDIIDVLRLLDYKVVVCPNSESLWGYFYRKNKYVGKTCIYQGNYNNVVCTKMFLKARIRLPEAGTFTEN